MRIRENLYIGSRRDGGFMKVDITFIQMGGTIDKAYPKAIGGYAFDIGDAAFISILEDLRPSFSYETKAICQKDSQDLILQDRQMLKDYINKSQCGHFVVTHGTDTMIETGQFIGVMPDKTVVLTGSLTPAAFKQSDAPIQLGSALMAAQLLPAGVYIAMNGIVKPIRDIGRDSKTGKFI